MKQTDFGTIVPDEDLSELSLEDAYDQACDSDEFLLCAAKRLGRAFNGAELGKEVRKILADQGIQKLMSIGKVAYNKDTNTFHSLEQQEGMA